ncbi:MAG: RagB/SusD family nutrient uptake outer membrane protein [Tunicatimonas sp.]
MTRLYNKILLLTGVLVTSLGCTDLEEELFSDVTTDTFFNTEEEFISALGAAYTNLYGIAGDGWFILQEVPSDEMIVPQRGADWFDNGAWAQLHTQEYNSRTPSMNAGWNFGFQGVNACNRVIETFEEAAEGLEGSEKFIAELRVLRALYYYMLMDLYGNVPIVDQFSVPADFAPTNNTRAEVFEFIETSIRDNIDLLDTEVGLNNYGRVTQWAAHAILAKLYLNAEVYTGEARWQDAVTEADAIINSGQYSLENNYFANFDTENQDSRENIFAVPYDPQFAPGHSIHMRTLHYANQNTYNLTAQPWNGFCSLQEFYDSYEDNDVRKANLIVGPQFNTSGELMTDPGANNAPIIFTPEVNQLAPNARRDAGARVGKYEIALGATQDLDNDFPIFRYGDILLMKAEALFRLNSGDGTALALVNQIRERSEVSPVDRLTADLLLAERGREMFAEAYRRQDLIRFGEYTSPWKFKNATPDYVTIFPVPFDQLNSNSNLRQNPGYAAE